MSVNGSTSPVGNQYALPSSCRSRIFQRTASSPGRPHERSAIADLRADAWAGCALAKSDLTANDLAEALTAVSKYPPSTQPGWAARVPALRLGYIHCGGDGSKFDAAAKQ